MPADSKRLSKLLGARARQVARRKVLDHVALGHANRVVVQRKSPPLVGIPLLSVASLLSTASTAASSPISIRELHNSGHVLTRNGIAPNQSTSAFAEERSPCRFLRDTYRVSLGQSVVQTLHAAFP